MQKYTKLYTSVKKYLKHIGNILRKYLEYTRQVLGEYRARTWELLGMYQESTRKVQESTGKYQ